MELKFNFNLDNKTAEVFGKGVFTFKRNGIAKTFENKAVINAVEFIL